jgi:recombinational DNA repair ATPase RecF
MRPAGGVGQGAIASGPHKADFRIRAEGTPVEDLLSRGQLKLLMCAFAFQQFAVIALFVPAALK